MSGRAIRNLYGKEMREILRNWGTLIVVIFMPLLAYPTVTLLLAQLSASQMEKLSHRTLSVAVAPARGAPELVKRLNAKEGLRVVASGSISPASVHGDSAQALHGKYIRFQRVAHHGELVRPYIEMLLEAPVVLLLPVAHDLYMVYGENTSTGPIGTAFSPDRAGRLLLLSQACSVDRASREPPATRFGYM